jgi:formiminotetrahydrofolate cyclodeaminase
LVVDKSLFLSIIFNVENSYLKLKGKKEMPNRTQEESNAIRKWILAALKDGANSPRKVQTWIEQNSDIFAPSIPTIANAMREEGYEPIGFVWDKKKGK